MKSVFTGLNERSATNISRGDGPFQNHNKSIGSLHGSIMQQHPSGTFLPVAEDDENHTGPDLREADFMDLACCLPDTIFVELMSRDDLICDSETDVLDVLVEYRK